MIYGYPVRTPEAVVVLVHGLGTRAVVWDLPESGRLARRIWRAGYAVYALDLNFVDGTDSLAKTRENLRAALLAISRQHRDKKVLGIGHDIGGTLLYQILAESNSSLDGVIGVGAQFGFGGYSKALEALFRAAASQPALTWPMLDGVSISRAGPGDVSVSELLLSSSLPEKTRLAFYSKALSRMPSGLLREIGALGHEEPVPVLDPVLAASKAQMAGPILAIRSVRWFIAPLAV